MKRLFKLLLFTLMIFGLNSVGYSGPVEKEKPVFEKSVDLYSFTVDAVEKNLSLNVVTRTNIGFYKEYKTNTLKSIELSYSGYYMSSPEIKNYKYLHDPGIENNGLLIYSNNGSLNSLYNSQINTGTRINYNPRE